MKRRIALALAVLALLTVGTTSAVPAQAANQACLINSGTITPATTITATTVMNNLPFTSALNVSCPTGASGTMSMSGVMNGTCSVWAATATAFGASLWGTGSVTVTLTPPTGFSASASLTITMTYRLIANGMAGIDCLNTTTSVTYWAVTGGMVIIDI